MTEEGRKEKERGQEHTQWGEVGEGEAVCGVSVTCPGGVAWVVCAALCVGGWGGGRAGVWCGCVVYRCHRGPCGRHGCARVACACGCWRGGAGEETEAERHRQAKDNTVCVCVWGGGGCGGRGGAGCECVCVGLHVWRVGRDRGRASQPGKGQRSVCVSGVCVCLWGRGGVWCSLWHVGPCESVLRGGGGKGG